MRPLKSHLPVNALPTLETVRKQTQEARVFRRAQAVREVVAGHHVHTVSATFHLANSAHRSQDDAKQREHYSGKKTAYAEAYGHGAPEQVDRLSGADVERSPSRLPHVETRVSA